MDHRVFAPLPLLLRTGSSEAESALESILAAELGHLQVSLVALRTLIEERNPVNSRSEAVPMSQHFVRDSDGCIHFL